MLYLYFNNLEIDKYILNLNNNERLYMPNGFLKINSDLEKLNRLKTELCVILDDISVRNNKESDTCFLELQAGNYYLENTDKEVVYEGKWFDNNYLIAEGYVKPNAGVETISNTDVINPDVIDSNNLESLLNRKKQLSAELIKINELIVNNFYNNMEVFDTTIEQIEIVRDTWKERLQNMLEGIAEIEEDTISVFQEIVTTLKLLAQKIVR